MSLNGNTLGTQIFLAISGLVDTDKQNVEKVWQTISQTIVAHFVANATVSTTVQPGTFNCPASPGPVVGIGTGSGTIS